MMASKRKVRIGCLVRLLIELNGGRGEVVDSLTFLIRGPRLRGSAALREIKAQHSQASGEHFATRWSLVIFCDRAEASVSPLWFARRVITGALLDYSVASGAGPHMVLDKDANTVQERI